MGDKVKWKWEEDGQLRTDNGFAHIWRPGNVADYSVSVKRNFKTKEEAKAWAEKALEVDP